MCALSSPNTAGEWPYDSSEVFSVDELTEAARLRQRVTPLHNLKRRDSCPHTPPCPGARVCIEEIAWYLRHRKDIEAS